MNCKHIVCSHRGSFLSYNRYWQDTNLNFEYLIDTSNGFLKPDHESTLYDEYSLRKDLNFEGEVSKKHYWNSQGNRNIIWFYAHLRMLLYFKKHPGYSYYWFYDDDVTVADWDIFHKAFENNDSDFISYYCFKHSQVTSQPLIPILDDNSTSGQGWFNRFPGHGDILFDDTTEYFGSFFPIVRLSNKALTKLSQCLDEGIYGYSEGFVPTILNYYGLKLDTIFDNTSTIKYLKDNQVDITHKNIKIDWSWI